MLRTLTTGELKEGMDVIFVDDTLNVHPLSTVDVPFESNAPSLRGKRCRVVRIQPNVPGKKIGVVFKDEINGGIDLDGFLPPKWITHGAWLVEGLLYTSEMYAEHKAAAERATGIDREAIEKLLEDF